MTDLNGNAGSLASAIRQLNELQNKSAKPTKDDIARNIVLKLCAIYGGEPPSDDELAAITWDETEREFEEIIAEIYGNDE